jgi:hypothetical protein
METTVERPGTGASTGRGTGSGSAGPITILVPVFVPIDSGEHHVSDPFAPRVPQPDPFLPPVAPVGYTDQPAPHAAPQLAPVAAAQPVGAAPDAAAKPPPAPVASAAAARNLGTLRRAQTGHNPITNFVTGLVASAVLLGLMWLLSWFQSQWAFFLWRWLALAICPVFVLSVLYTLIAPFGGFKGTWRYDGGLVYRKNRKVTVLAWSEIDEVQLWKAGGDGVMRGKLLSWLVIGYNGAKIDIDAKEDKSFGEEICGIVASLGRQVKDGGPYVGKLRK